MVKLGSIFYLCVCFIVLSSVPTARSASPHFEDVDIRAVDSDAWYNVKLSPRQASNPSSPTSTTTPTSTNSAGFPVGTKPPTSPCKSSADCSTGNCQAGVCKEPSPAGSYGCYKNQNCGTGNCFNGKCVPKPGEGKVGDSCNGSYQCAEGTFCQNSKCGAKQNAGSACYKAAGCASGHCQNGKCIDAGTTKNGDGCTSSAQCGPNSFCNKRKCATLGGHGAPCYKKGGCLSNVCRRRQCV